MPRPTPKPIRIPPPAELSEASAKWQEWLNIGPRRAEVAQLVSIGVLSDKELATALGISCSRAHEHVQRLMHLLGVDSRGRLALALAGHRFEMFSRRSTEDAVQNRGGGAT